MSVLLGTLSGILFILAVPPISAPFASFFIFTPLVFLAARGSISKKDLLLASFIAGTLGAGVLSYHLFSAFPWPADPILQNLVHHSYLAWGVLVGSIWTGCLLVYRWLRTSSCLLNAGLFASLYLGFEQALQFITGQYYIGALSHTVTFLPETFAVAALGGAPSVSFSIAFIGAFIGEYTVAKNRRVATLQFVGLCAVIASICTAHAYYIYNSPSPAKSLSITTIQTGEKDGVLFARSYDGNIFFPELAALLREASLGETDLIVYPLAIANAVIYESGTPPVGDGALQFLPRSTLESWVATNAPASSMVVTWDIVWREGQFLQNYHFWASGKIVGAYSKRHPYAFIEKPPTLPHFGFGPTPAPISPGKNSGLTTLPGGTIISNLQCSEVHLAQVARVDAASAHLFLALGLEWTLPQDIGETHSLKSAQFRAAESNIPAIRASIQGPSAIINSTGKIINELDFNQKGILRDTVQIKHEHRRTFYSLAGNLPLYLGVGLMLVLAFLNKRKGAYIS